MSGAVAWGGGIISFGMVLGNYNKIEANIGILGIALIPVVFIGSWIYSRFLAKKKQAITDVFHNIEQPLSDLGLKYHPFYEDNPGRRLWVKRTSERLRINDFLSPDEPSPRETNMVFSQKQKKEIANAILDIDRLWPELEKAHKIEHDASYFNFFSVSGSFLLFFAMLAGQYDVIEANIGIFGIVLIPIIFIGSIIYCGVCSKKHGRIADELHNIEQTLSDLDLKYHPFTLKSGPVVKRLSVKNSFEELNISDFLSPD